jgi:hypothetical protein
MLSTLSHNCCCVARLQQTKVHACGILYIGTAAMNNSFSVASISTPECLQQQGLVAGSHSCSRCPVIASETEYDVLLVAEALGVSSAPVHTTVSAAAVSLVVGSSGAAQEAHASQIDILSSIQDSTEDNNVCCNGCMSHLLLWS